MELIVNVIKNISVEPIMFLQYMALSFNRMAATIFTLTAVCVQRYGDDPMVDCRNRTGEIQDSVQAEAIMWITKTAIASTAPEIIANLILGNWHKQTWAARVVQCFSVLSAPFTNAVTCHDDAGCFFITYKTLHSVGL